MTGLVAVVAVLATYRLALLVTADEITRARRETLLARLDRPAHEVVDREFDGAPGVCTRAQCKCGLVQVADTAEVDVRPDVDAHIASKVHERDRSWWANMLDCAWCVSVWLSGPVAWSAWCFGTRAWWFVPALALSASAGTGYLSQQASP